MENMMDKSIKLVFKLQNSGKSIIHRFINYLCILRIKASILMDILFARSFRYENLIEFASIMIGMKLYVSIPYQIESDDFDIVIHPHTLKNSEMLTISILNNTLLKRKLRSFKLVAMDGIINIDIEITEPDGNVTVHHRTYEKLTRRKDKNDTLPNVGYELVRLCMSNYINTFFANIGRRYNNERSRNV